MYAYFSKTKLYCWLFTLKIRYAPIKQTMEEENKKKMELKIKVILANLIIREMCLRKPPIYPRKPRVSRNTV
jgi:hypothetical protein